jgi:hypothetical protein
MKRRIVDGIRVLGGCATAVALQSRIENVIAERLSLTGDQ